MPGRLKKSPKKMNRLHNNTFHVFIIVYVLEKDFLASVYYIFL